MSRLFENRFVQRILQINDTPEAISLGAAVGAFISMTPTVGIQILLMIIVGTVIRANRIAGIVMVHISNPFTVLPIYWLDYWVGSRLLGFETMTYERFKGTCGAFMDDLGTEGLWSATLGFVAAHLDIVLAMWVGGVLLGVLLALPVYPLTLRLVVAHRRHKAKLLEEALSRHRRVAETGVTVEEE